MPEELPRFTMNSGARTQKNFRDVPENFDEKLFLMSFDEDEVKELIYHNQPNSFRNYFPVPFRDIPHVII